MVLLRLIVIVAVIYGLLSFINSLGENRKNTNAASKPKQPLAYYVMLGIGLALITAFIMFVQGFSSCFGGTATWCEGGSGTFFMFGLPVIVFLAVLIFGINHKR